MVGTGAPTQEFKSKVGVGVGQYWSQALSHFLSPPGSGETQGMAEDGGRA